MSAVRDGRPPGGGPGYWRDPEEPEGLDFKYDEGFFGWFLAMASTFGLVFLGARALAENEFFLLGPLALVFLTGCMVVLRAKTLGGLELIMRRLAALERRFPPPEPRTDVSPAPPGPGAGTEAGTQKGESS